MRTVLAISDSVENTQFDLSRSIGTIKDLGLDPLAIVPTFFRQDGSSESFDVTENIDYCFDECSFEAIKLGYITTTSVLDYLYNKLGGAKNDKLFLEPFLISDSGDILVDEDVYRIVSSKFAPICKLIVLNSFEAELLAEFECRMPTDYLRAAKKIFNLYGCLVLIKGSERTDGKTILFDGFKTNTIAPKLLNIEFDPEKYNLATAIVCFMAKGMDISEAVDTALSFMAGTYVVEEEVISFPSKEDIFEAPSEPVVEDIKIDEKLNEEINASAEEVISKDLEQVEESIEKAVIPPVETVEEKPLVVPSFKVPTFKMPTISMPKTAVPSLRKPEEKPEVKVETPVVEEAASTAESTSLVSPSKSIRDIARVFDKKETTDATPAVTTAIEKPAPGPLGAVSDLAKPGFKLKTEVNKSIVDFEELRNRLNSLTGSDNK